jgi:hypothetical protein
MNGNGNEEKPSHETRLSNIEAIQSLMLRDHEEFRQEHKRLLVAQVLLADAQRENEKKLAELVAVQAKSMDELRESGKRVDARIEALVIAIGDFIRRVPPLPGS